jgi:hypothetical protein
VIEFPRIGAVFPGKGHAVRFGRIVEDFSSLLDVVPGGAEGALGFLLIVVQHYRVKFSLALD